jgi:hypothetical protein
MIGWWARCPCCGQLLPPPYPCVPWRPLPGRCPRHPFLTVDEAVAQARQALGAGLAERRSTMRGPSS